MGSMDLVVAPSLLLISSKAASPPATAFSASSCKSIPPLFLNIGPAIGKGHSHTDAWKKTTCKPLNFTCSSMNFPTDLTICQDVVGCSTILQIALLQAKEFNDEVILVEVGGMCRDWCQVHGIVYVDVAWSVVKSTFCKLSERSASMFKTDPAILESVFLMAVLRWPLLDEYLQGHLEGSSAPPACFNMCDHDQMVYVNSTYFFHRFRDSQMAICSYFLQENFISANGIYSMFTVDSFHDLVSYYSETLPFAPVAWGSDMDMLSSYLRLPGALIPQNMVRPNYTANNSCMPFEDGRVSEAVYLDRENRYILTKDNLRAVFYRGGYLHYRLRSNPDKFERQFAVHFQGSNKLIMHHHFRPNLDRVLDGPCRSCLTRDCDCDVLSCEKCWFSCSLTCEVLQQFDKSWHTPPALPLGAATGK